MAAHAHPAGGFHPHLPGLGHRLGAKLLGASMWFWIFYRARKDGPVMLLRSRSASASPPVRTASPTHLPPRLSLPSPPSRLPVMLSTLPPDHPPIPTTSTAQFPTRPPPACPMSQLAATRPNSPNADHRWAGEVFTLGTRNSKLAMVQTEIVRRELEKKWPGCQIRIFGMTTLGDNVQTQPLYTFGGKALWTKELEVELLSGQVDAIVHSLKDVPTEFPPGCELGAVLEREDPSDALVVKQGLPYTSLEEMPEGSVIGTSSVRRVAQLRRKFPGLKFADVRGNLGTRLRKLDDPTSSYTALILASAGLLRLNLGHRITSPVTSPTLYHAVGQGAIGIEIREGDERGREIIGSLECWKTSWRTRAERMMLKVLEGGCSVPVGCETTLTEVWVKGGEGDQEAHGGSAKTNGFIPHADPLLPSSPPKANGVRLTANGHSHSHAPPVSTGLTIPALHTCPHHASPTSLHHATLTLTGTITSLSGTHAVLASVARKVHSAADCEALGRDIALELIEGGGKEILTELGRHVKEVGGDELDGRPIPSVPNSNGPGTVHAIPIEADHAAAAAAVAAHLPVDIPGPPAAAAAASPPSSAQTSKSPAKSPHGRTVFKEGEVCLRPAGW
ncbi:hypothetical protein JCM21900_006150 [Sporobolomyces salmonicolor]